MHAAVRSKVSNIRTPSLRCSGCRPWSHWEHALLCLFEALPLFVCHVNWRNFKGSRNKYGKDHYSVITCSREEIKEWSAHTFPRGWENSSAKKDFFFFFLGAIVFVCRCCKGQITLKTNQQEEFFEQVAPRIWFWSYKLDGRMCFWRRSVFQLVTSNMPLLSLLIDKVGGWELHLCFARYKNIQNKNLSFFWQFLPFSQRVLWLWAFWDNASSAPFLFFVFFWTRHLLALRMKRSRQLGSAHLRSF